MNKTLGVGLRLCLIAFATLANADIRNSAGAAQGEHLGTVSFPVSCAPAVQTGFNRGVALLHDFWYEEARPQFEKILKADPQCAMAHWGLAMSGFHQIWDRPDEANMAAGWREMQAAQAHPAKTPREREYIAALANFFQPGKEAFSARIDAYATTAKSRPPVRTRYTCPDTFSRGWGCGRRI